MNPSGSIAWVRSHWQSDVAVGWVLAFALIQTAAGIAATLYGWPIAVGPIAVTITVLAMVFPRVGLALLMLAMFSKHSLPGTNGIYASDVLSLPVMVGALIRGFSLPRSPKVRNPLWAPMIAIVIYFGLTILWALHPVPALVNWLRHVQLIILCLLIVQTVEIEDMPKILAVMVITTAAISFYTVGEFAATGGRERVFGPTGWFFTTFLAMSMIHASVGAMLSDRLVSRVCWIAGAALCFLGLIATQTRSAMLQALLGILIAVLFAWLWAGWNKRPHIRRRIVILVALTAAMILVFLFGHIGLFETASERVEQALEGRSNTIFIRLLLWKMGWTVFADSPVFGVGLGQASRWSEQVNFFHLDPAAPRAGGLGVHNDAITYLAETGIIGTGLIFWLLWVVIRLGWRLLKTVRDEKHVYQLLVLLAPAGAVIAHYFYSAYLFYSIGGMVVAYYFGMLARLYMSWQEEQLAKPVEEST